MKLHTLRHIACVQTAFLGDCALALYLTEELRQRAPKALITMVCTPASAELVSHASAVDRVVVFDKRGRDAGLNGLRRVASGLRESGVDCILGLQRSARTSLLCRLSGASLSVGYRQATMSFLYDQRINWDLSKHEVDRNRSFLSVFEDVPATTEAIGVQFKDDGSENLPQTLFHSKSSSSDRVVIAPGSVWFTKRWPQDYYAQLAAELVRAGKEVVLIGSRDDATMCESIAEQSGAMSLAGRCTLPQTLGLMRAAKWVVTNDSAPTHLAGLVGSRTLTIYGSTLPSFGFAPRGAKDVIVEQHGLSCRPCGLHGRNSCPQHTLACLRQSSVSEVLGAINQ